MMIRIPGSGQDEAIALHLIIDVGERKNPDCQHKSFVILISCWSKWNPTQKEKNHWDNQVSMHRLLMVCYSVLNGGPSQTGHQDLH
jgi:hypothetical protein